MNTPDRYDRIAAAYREHSREEPPHVLDALILAAASNEAKTLGASSPKPARAKRSVQTWWPRLGLGFAAAIAGLMAFNLFLTDPQSVALKEREPDFPMAAPKSVPKQAPADAAAPAPTPPPLVAEPTSAPVSISTSSGGRQAQATASAPPATSAPSAKTSGELDQAMPEKSGAPVSSKRVAIPERPASPITEERVEWHASRPLSQAPGGFEKKHEHAAGSSVSRGVAASESEPPKAEPSAGENRQEHVPATPAPAAPPRAAEVSPAPAPKLLPRAQSPAPSAAEPERGALAGASATLARPKSIPRAPEAVFGGIPPIAASDPPSTPAPGTDALADRAVVTQGRTAKRDVTLPKPEDVMACVTGLRLAKTAQLSPVVVADFALTCRRKFADAQWPDDVLPLVRSASPPQ